MFAFQDTLGPVGVGFTDRAGGVSRDPFSSLNLAVSTPDDSASVRENLRRVMAAFTGSPDGRLARMRQVHGSQVAVVRGATARAGGPDEAAAIPEADALVTAEAGLVLMVLVADCVPILVADPDRGVVAAVHAGRVGVRSGVVPAALEQMRHLGAVELTAWVGPHVCGACYEVPEAMREEVAEVVPQTWGETSWGTPALDLGAGVTASLQQGGATVIQVDRCTLEHQELFSHRRDAAGAGRMAGLVWLRP